MKTVLLAEPHAPTLEHVAAELTQAGYAVRSTNDAGTAMELLVSERPDAVVVAVDLPKLDGWHLGPWIRNSTFGARVPILAIDKGHLGKARGVPAILDLQANAYVPDPTKIAELTAKLRELLIASEKLGTSFADGIQTVLARPPIASGELRGYGLPQQMHSLYRLERNGVLVVVSRELTRRIFLLRGLPVSFDSSAGQDSLPSYLVERNDLTQAQADAVAQALRDGLRIGAALADAGVELEGEQLVQRLREYTREKVAGVFSMREGRYAFYAGTEFAEQIAALEIPALAPILEGARRSFPLKVYAQSLKGQLGDYPHRSPEFGSDLAALALDRQDLKIAMQLNGRISLDDVLAHGRGDLRESYSLVWFLKLTGDILFSKTPAATHDQAQYSAEDRIAPRKRKPLPAEVATELQDAAVKIITGSYYRVLGLDLAADTEAVEKAYHEVAMRFHPDSYPEFDTSEIQDLLEAVMDKLSASYRVLSVEEKRKAYIEYLFSRLDASNRSMPLNVDAEIALKRGEAALRRKDPRSALIAFEEAVKINPREPEYYSRLAWATYLAGSGERKDRARAAQKLTRKALALNPLLERPNIIWAIIEGEMGGHAAARKQLLKVLESNSNAALAKVALRRVGR